MIAYVIIESDKIVINSIRHGKTFCIESFIKASVYGNWKVAKSFGCKCIKVRVNVERL